MAKIQPVTLAEIARQAGVCPATVSLSLRNHASISAATRRRITALAKKLGYRPHPGVSALMSSIRSHRPTNFKPVIAAITTWIGGPAERDPTRQRFFAGAVERARELGYTLEEFWLFTPGLTVQRLEGILHARGVHGVLVLPLEKPIVLPFRWERFAAATIGYTFDQAMLHRAVPAYFENVVVALRELWRRGYRRVGLVNTAALRDRLLRNWLGAFCAWHSESGPAPADAVLQIRSDDEAQFRAWIKKYNPDAIIFGGTPVYAWVQAMGLSVPRDIGLVALCVAGTPQRVRLACVTEKPEVVAAAAVDLIVEQLQRNEAGIPPDAKEVLITGQWTEGFSVRPPGEVEPGEMQASFAYPFSCFTPLSHPGFDPPGLGGASLNGQADAGRPRTPR
jgi:LacI family transcriptional regulator